MPYFGDIVILKGLWAIVILKGGQFHQSSSQLDYLVKIQICRYSLISDPARNQLLVIARLFSFLSTAPLVMCMSGCTSDVLQTVEQLKKGIEYPFRYQVLSMHKLMHKREGSVFGRIDLHIQLNTYWLT